MTDYKIIGGDDRVYGPIDLETMRQWIGDDRVNARTWICEIATDRWLRAATIPELADLFIAPEPSADIELGSLQDSTLTPAQLRRVKVLADMTDNQLARFACLVESVQVKAPATIVSMQQRGDCMYLVFTGEVRLRQLVQGRDTMLDKREAGDFFGEMALFSEGPRSADAVAAQDCTLLKITKKAFQNIMDNHPDIGVRLLAAMIRIIEARIQSINKKYTQMISTTRLWSSDAPSRPSPK